MILKKIGAAIVATLALAAMVAGPASATEALLYSGGSAVPTGTGIEGSNVGNVKFQNGEATIFECSNVSTSGTVTTNSSSTAAITISSVQFKGTQAEEKCYSGSMGAVSPTLTTPACLRHNVGSEAWKLRGSACNAETTKLVLAVKGTLFSCSYERTAEVGLTSPLNSSPLRLSTSSYYFTVQSPNSPACAHSLAINGTIELKTSTGGSLTLVA